MKEKIRHWNYRNHENFAEDLGKIPIVISDSPGFLVNRMLLPMINEAVFILDESVASKDQAKSRHTKC